MMEDEMNNDNNANIEERLKAIYYDSKNPASLSSVPALAHAAAVSIPRAKEWLKSQPTYTLHRQARKRYPTRRYYVNTIDEQWQGDLADMIDFQRWNNGHRHILTVIDTLTLCFD